MKILNIEGWPASGKTTIWGLLDGSDEIFVDPLHHFTHYTNLSEKKCFNVREFRKAISKTEYYKIEQYSDTKYFPVSYGSDKNKDLNFKFNFKLFDSLFKNAICNEEISSEKFSETFAKYYVSELFGDSHQFKYFATMSNYFEYKKFVSSNLFHHSKTIVILRNAIDIIASRVSRKPRFVDGNNTKVFSPSFYSLIFNGEVEEINSFNHYYIKLSKTYPENVFVVYLDELIFQKEHCIHSICEFLNVKFSPIFLSATRDGISIENNSLNLSNKVNDIYSNILNIYQIIIIYILQFIWMIHKKPVCILSPYSIAKYLYLKIKRLR